MPKYRLGSEGCAWVVRSCVFGGWRGDLTVGTEDRAPERVRGCMRRRKTRWTQNRRNPYLPKSRRSILTSRTAW
ncbi:hypothetical protein AAMO2058_001144600 [Amorphochlora amoebiformis]